jgi:hypothetical protein
MAITGKIPQTGRPKTDVFDVNLPGVSEAIRATAPKKKREMIGCKQRNRENFKERCQDTQKDMR